MKNKIIEQEIKFGDIRIQYSSDAVSLIQPTERINWVIIQSDKRTQVAKSIDYRYQDVEDERDELKIKLAKYEPKYHCKLFTSKTPNGNCDFCGKILSSHS